MDTTETVQASPGGAQGTARPTSDKPKKSRKKRSWTSVTTKIEDKEWTFWITPAGVHLRLKRSRMVQTKPFRDLRDFISNQLTMPL